MRAAVVGVVAALAAGVAAGAAAAPRERIVRCHVDSLSLSYAPDRVVVRAGKRTLLTATRSRAVFSATCSRVRADLGVDRVNLDNRGVRGRLACLRGAADVLLQVEPARGGTRVVVWLQLAHTEIVEAMLTRKAPWFEYAPTACRPA